MIHDVWGLSDHTRDDATRLAREGFAVLAIDLYRRDRPAKIADPGAFMRALWDPQVLPIWVRARASSPRCRSRVAASACSASAWEACTR